MKFNKKAVFDTTDFTITGNTTNQVSITLDINKLDRIQIGYIYNHITTAIDFGKNGRINFKYIDKESAWDIMINISNDTITLIRKPGNFNMSKFIRYIRADHAIIKRV